MKNKSLIFLSLFCTLLFAVFYACQKDVQTPESTSILKFASLKEFDSTLKIVSAFSDNERKSWEDSKGIKSFGRVCEDFYNKVDFEKFQTTSELESFVKTNSKYLVMTTDENGEKSMGLQSDNNPYKYLVNENMMFQINGTVYKYLDNSLISTKAENKKDLLGVSSKSSVSHNDGRFKIAETKVTDLLKDQAVNCGTYKSSYACTRDKDRTFVRVQLYQQDIWDDVNGYWVGTLIRGNTSVAAEKKTLGIWMKARRTMTATVNMRIHYFDNYTWREYPIQGTLTQSEVWNLNYEVGFWSPIGTLYNTSAHFGPFYCTGSTPSTSQSCIAEVRCGM